MRFEYDNLIYEGDRNDIVARVGAYMSTRRLKAYHSQVGGISIFRLGSEEMHISDVQRESMQNEWTVDKLVRDTLTRRVIDRIPADLKPRPDLDLIQVFLFSDGSYNQEVDF